MEIINSKVISSLLPAVIAVLLAVYFAASAFGECKRAEPPCPSLPARDDHHLAGGVVNANGALVSGIMLANQGYDLFEDGCFGSSCDGTDPCCRGCLCFPLLGRSTGICFGICCLLP